MNYLNYAKEEFEQLSKSLLLIASENYPSQEVLNASGSIFQLPYTEGFPGKRYYCGCEVVDKMEQDCIDKCLELFNAKGEYNANVQPNSGASANMIVYNAILNPGDTVLAMDVKAGGHISHSHPKSFLSKYHNVIKYEVDENGYLNYDEIEDLCIRYNPKLIVCGASNYSRIIDFKRFRKIADEMNALLMADIAHISSLVAHGEHPSPVGIADFITSTTHKCLRGPRGAFIIYKKEFEKAIQLSTIPGLFGGPLQHQIYAKLVCFNEMLTPEAKEYSKQIIKNAKKMEEVFKQNIVPLVTNGTDNHLMTIDLTEYAISGKTLAGTLERLGVIANCNTVPKDPRSFLETSGIRVGVPAITARGFKEDDIAKLTQAIADVINCYRKDYDNTDRAGLYEKNLKEIVQILIEKYPLSGIYEF